jgi:ABC-2 type transport system permease protein
VLTAAAVVVVARAFTPIDLTLAAWLRILAYALYGGVPFVLIGIALGYWTSARAAVPIATACNLLLAYAGGLWLPPAELPKAVQTISPLLPTRALADLFWGVAGGGNALRGVAVLAVYTVLFALLAAVGYRRDERTRYA